MNIFVYANKFLIYINFFVFLNTNNAKSLIYGLPDAVTLHTESNVSRAEFF